MVSKLMSATDLEAWRKLDPSAKEQSVSKHLMPEDKLVVYSAKEERPVSLETLKHAPPNVFGANYTEMKHFATAIVCKGKYEQLSVVDGRPDARNSAPTLLRKPLTFDEFIQLVQSPNGPHLHIVDLTPFTEQGTEVNAQNWPLIPADATIRFEEKTAKQAHSVEISYTPHPEIFNNSSLFTDRVEYQSPCSSAIAEFIDNSISATKVNDDSRDIHVMFSFAEDPKNSNITIIDNGPGMSLFTIKDWATLAKNPDVRHLPQPQATIDALFIDGEISKFGVGSKDAGLFLGRKITLISRQRDKCVNTFVLDPTELNKRAASGVQDVYHGTVQSYEAGTGEETRIFGPGSIPRSFTIMRIENLHYNNFFVRAFSFFLSFNCRKLLSHKIATSYTIPGMLLGHRGHRSGQRSPSV